MAPLPDEFKTIVYNTLCAGNDIWDNGAKLVDELDQQFGRVPKLVIACPDNHKLAWLVKQKNPCGEWRAAVCGFVALCYGPGLETITWHETFHLLGADDCYALPNDEGPNCDHPKCIMQYAPGKYDTKEWPFLYGQNLDKMRKIWDKCLRE